MINWRTIFGIGMGFLSYLYWYSAKIIMELGLDDAASGMAFGLCQFSSFLLAIFSIILIIKSMENKSG